MFKQQIAHSREILKSDIHHCLEVDGFSFVFEVDAEVCVIYHKLVFGSCDDSNSVLSFTNEVLDHVNDILFLERLNLGANKHIT